MGRSRQYGWLLRDALNVVGRYAKPATRDRPERERTVFEMHFYFEMPQAEIARALAVHPRQVSYLWVAATEHLADQLDPLGGVLA